MIIYIGYSLLPITDETTDGKDDHEQFSILESRHGHRDCRHLRTIVRCRFGSRRGVKA
jgi:hypothetical protein